MNLTPEQRKRIAEWMGREAVIIPDDNPFSEDDTPLVMLVADGAIYTPDTNDSQAFELLRKLVNRMWHREPYKPTIAELGIFLQRLINPETNELSRVSICHAVLALITENEHE